MEISERLTDVNHQLQVNDGVIPGNACLFIIFLALNFVLCMGSVAILIMACYIWYMTGSFNAYVEFPFYFSLTLLLLSLCSSNLKKRMHMLKLYLWIQTMVCFILTMFIVLMKFKTEQFKKWA